MAQVVVPALTAQVLIREAVAVAQRDLALSEVTVVDQVLEVADKSTLTAQVAVEEMGETEGV